MKELERKIKRLASSAIVSKLNKNKFSAEEREIALNVLKDRNVEYEAVAEKQYKGDRTEKVQFAAAPNSSKQKGLSTLTGLVIRSWIGENDNQEWLRIKVDEPKILVYRRAKVCTKL